ncbi:MAG: ParB N-terminal domain-containing protein [Desulfobacteraceae bacterium]|nr:ParB N-terminal domain-containing protein [Desulfobacteraceae bacterium]
MQAEQESIDTALIDLSDQKYFYTDQQGIEELAGSVGFVGLISPPVLQAKHKGGFRVVAGFRRVSACISLNLEQIPARVITAETDALYCFQVSVADNAATRALNMGEQCSLVENLHNLCGTKEAVSQALEPAGLRVPPALVEKFIRLSKMPDEVRQGVSGNYLSLNTALDMESLSRASAIAVAGVFRKLRPGLNQQREILEGLRDLAGRGETSIDSMLEGPEFSDITDSYDIDRGRRFSLLRSLLYRKRYPALSRAEDAFYRRKKNLGIGGDMDLKPPAYFEDTVYTMILRFSSARHLCSHAEALGRICRHPDLEAILKREIEDTSDLY